MPPHHRVPCNAHNIVRTPVRCVLCAFCAPRVSIGRNKTLRRNWFRLDPRTHCLRRSMRTCFMVAWGRFLGIRYELHACGDRREFIAWIGNYSSTGILLQSPHWATHAGVAECYEAWALQWRRHRACGLWLDASHGMEPYSRNDLEGRASAYVLANLRKQQAGSSTSTDSHAGNSNYPRQLLLSAMLHAACLHIPATRPCISLYMCELSSRPDSQRSREIVPQSSEHLAQVTRHCALCGLEDGLYAREKRNWAPNFSRYSDALLVLHGFSP